VNDDFFDIEAVSPDNVIEAIKVKNKRFILGVQWHPEDLDDIYSYYIFKALIINCK
ncbi:gamma-glutamyl-gamma-aminobutyrate hydrolase family protein, partial [bacterium]|nr:gamma-glutamyl-gamma-aminobutyrate hydrolase family protein [bacterium]MBD8923330.1 gamma-glutamyl-gamma-aminobutyrate hydrolase family protein [bacterium]